VKTQVRPPIAPPEPPATTVGPRRRRWLRWVALVVVLIIVAAFIAGVSWIARYDPLARGSIGYAPPAGVDAKVVDVSYAIADAPLIFRIPAVTGMTFRYRFSIRNDGPVAITIRDVGIPVERTGNVVNRHPVRVMTNAYATPTGSPWIAFQPFTLAPGQEGAIEMEATLHGCVEDMLGWGDEEMTYTVFGISRHVMFVPDVELTLVGGPGSPCPRS
jgi:hypothetical protein